MESDASVGKFVLYFSVLYVFKYTI